LVVVVLLVAAFFRLHRITAVPPGPSHDELRMIDLGELIVEGERPIHWTVSYSAEPLFMYALAVSMPVWGFTPFGARVVTRFAGMLLIPVVYVLARRLFGRPVALVAGAVLAMTWWPVFFSRVALRGITLPLVFAISVYTLWRGFDLGGVEGRCRAGAVRWGWLALGGILMGLTWYTFTAARGLCIVLPVLLIHLAWVRLLPPKRLWPIALVTVGLAALIAAPFVYQVRVHPGAPEARLQQLGGVIQDLRAGNLVPFVRQTVATLGMFTVTGDPNWRYSISGRPILGPGLAVLAMVGLGVSVGRWRQPRYFLLLAWLALGLAPSMLTPEAPSLVRAIGALPAAALLPATGAGALWTWIAARLRRRLHWLIPGVVTLILAGNGLSTFRDLFVAWPSQPQVREIYQAALTEAFRDLNHSDLKGPLWISEPFPDDRHLLLAQRVLWREEVEPRWFDASRALILPPADGVRRYLVADFVSPDLALFGRWMDRASAVLNRTAPDEALGPAYRVYQVQGGPWVVQELAEIAARSAVFLDLEARRPVPLPARFEDVATLVGYELLGDHVDRSEEVYLILYWCVNGPVYDPLASFAHLLNERNEVVGQYDGFDVPPWHWEPGAIVAQVYRFPVDSEAQPGVHWLEVGLYNPQTMERLNILGDDGALLSDRLLLKRVVLQ
jgi:4-amino-4-deoxy-L-arabinose transferase-like glycosyltransferase